MRGARVTRGGCSLLHDDVLEHRCRRSRSLHLGPGASKPDHQQSISLGCPPRLKLIGSISLGAGVYGAGGDPSEEVQMYSRILALTTAAFILACGTIGAFAQNQMTRQPDQQQMQSHPMDHEGEGAMGHGSMMGGGMM